MDRPPRRYKPPPINEEPGCVKAWEELIEEQGYPMACVGKTAQGYFSAGWEAAMKICSGENKWGDRLAAGRFVPIGKPKKMPKG